VWRTREVGGHEIAPAGQQGRDQVAHARHRDDPQRHAQIARKFQCQLVFEPRFAFSTEVVGRGAVDRQHDDLSAGLDALGVIEPAVSGGRHDQDDGGEHDQLA